MSDTPTPHAADPILCYVSEGWAYFTPRELDKQWGDDWNDAPYWCNAESPYGDYITMVGFWSHELQEARSFSWGNNVSVETINSGRVPWLANVEHEEAPKVNIHAGTPLSEFKRIVRELGGEIYVKEEA